MNTVIQLDMFEKDEVSLLRDDVEDLRKRGDNVRKGTFARIKNLGNDMIFLHMELMKQKEEINKLKLFLQEK